MEFASETFRVLTAVCFFALAAVVAAYGVKVSEAVGLPVTLSKYSTRRTDR